MPTARTPENTRWTRSAEKLEILYKIRGEWLSLGLRTRSVLPVPSEWESYFEDLRRGRLDIGKTVARFFDTIERRDLGWEGRRAGERIIALLHQYLDLCMPPELARQRTTLMPATQKPTRVRAARFAKRDNRTGTDD